MIGLRHSMLTPKVVPDYATALQLFLILFVALTTSATSPHVLLAVARKLQKME